MHIWSWHSGNHALVTPVPTPDGKVAFLAFPVSVLRAAGWKVDEEGMRKALPRFDEGPALVTDVKDSDVRSAAALAASQRDLGSRIRRH